MSDRRDSLPWFASSLDAFDQPRVWRGLKCCICGRFVSRKTGRIVHEYGDYGSILSSEVECRRHTDSATSHSETRP